MTSIREGTPLDGPFLEAMLYEAFFWRSGSERPPMSEMRCRAEFSMLLAGWGRAGDRAQIAEYAGAAAGAAWFRLWTPDVHSYGFVDEQTPELGLAVVPDARGRGIGRALLRAAIAVAISAGFPGLSLSVDPENPARRLYESEGFVKVGVAGTSWTLSRSFAGTGARPGSR